MTPEIYIFVPGIMTVPASDKNWCGKAVTWIHIYTDDKAEKVEYFSGIFTRQRKESERAQKLSTVMAYYLNFGWTINIAAHSNGADVVMDSLRAQNYPEINKLHLISAACEADFEKNGLNNAPVNDITVWIAAKDKALKLAATEVGEFLGYGTLGKTGAISATVPVNYIEEDFHHTEWFSETNFPETMERITQ